MVTESYTTLEKYDPITGAFYAYKDFKTAREATDYANDRTVFYADDDYTPLRYRIVTVTEVQAD